MPPKPPIFEQESARLYPEDLAYDYLALLDPAQQAVARAYTHGGHWVLLWGTLVSLFASWLVLKS